MELLSIDQRNQVLSVMMRLLDENREALISANQNDLNAFDPSDRAMYDRLIMNDSKIDGMIQAVKDIHNDSDPIGVLRYEWTHPNGMLVQNKTAPFGTILIIYESRPDVTIEAAVVAFKSNNRILLKGGKEAVHSNQALINLWHRALVEVGLSEDWITLLNLQRRETQSYLKNPPSKIDLIVPRGGDSLIAFVKAHATCPILVSGRGNNFMYVHHDADVDMATELIIESKIQKISACNALDKVLIHRDLPNIEAFLSQLIYQLIDKGVEVIVSRDIANLIDIKKVATLESQQLWYEEFLSMKILIGVSTDMKNAVSAINTYSGGHSASVVTEQSLIGQQFMDAVDSAAVYHNASTRFTDGGQMGIGAELAISTDKLHHRGPLGLHQLVTNKWYVFGRGHIRQ